MFTENVSSVIGVTFDQGQLHLPAEDASESKIVAFLLDTDTQVTSEATAPYFLKDMKYSAVRAEFVSSSENPEVKRFFDEEFNDIYIHHFNDAVLPILNFVGEYQLYLGKNMKKEGLVELLQKNRVVVVSFDPHFFGKRMISFLAGAIINQMYILAITGKLQDKPTILAIDEFL
jgi:hypothetical protein